MLKKMSNKISCVNFDALSTQNGSFIFSQNIGAQKENVKTTIIYVLERKT